MMISKALRAALVASAALTLCNFAFATTYNFYFKDARGVETSNAFIEWNGTSVTGGGGSIGSKNLISFSGNSLEQFSFKYDDGSNNVYGVNFSSSNYTIYNTTTSQQQVSYTMNSSSWGYVTKSLTTPGGQDSLMGYVTPLGKVVGDVPPSEIPVPEIDGEKLPQFIILMCAMFLAFRARSRLNGRMGSMCQLA